MTESARTSRRAEENGLAAALTRGPVDGAGLLYGLDGGWELACVAAAGLLVAASVLIRPALRRVGAVDRPEPSADLPAVEVCADDRA